ncbi:MAG: 23S rRNA (uracil(1939)-C(5))-methyltransferase RlmD [Patescibacteria group bacterium]|jgi:23S rRNA (uracil1939-C5)-methyltransferase
MKINIEKIVFAGCGLGHLKYGKKLQGHENSPGKAVFVKKVVPGDIVEIKLTDEKKDHAFGIVKEVIKPSPMRIDPPCPYFYQCGGCEHQNLSYPNQLKIKDELFKELIQRRGIQINSEPMISGSNHPFFYRNSIRFFFIIDENNKISFARHHFKYDQGYVKVDSCLLQSETCNTIMSRLKEYINEKVEHKSAFWQLKVREGKMIGDFMVEIITSSDELPDKSGIVNTLKSIKGVKSVYHTIAPGKSLKKLQRRLLFGSPVIYEKIGTYNFQISPESFFQTNSLGVKTLYDVIKNYANIEVGDNVFDLYCGTGTIGIYLSTLAKNVTGVEIVPEAVRDAIDNAKINKRHNVEFVHNDALKFLGSSSCELENSIIILDPPRAGLDKRLIKILSKVNFKRIVYTSCNPATFARDIKYFKEVGLKLTRLQPIDMFPQTHHIECVGVIVR